jgi:dihydropteroate synthase
VDDAGPEERLGGTIAACLWSAAQGADVLRVHDVRAVRQALRVTDVLRQTPAQPEPEVAHV